MKIAIISDTHDNIVNLAKALSWMEKNKVEQIIHCGDMCNADTLKFLSESFLNKINLVYGNMELYDEKEAEQHKNINFLGRYGVISVADKQVGACHEPWFVDKILKKNKCEIIFYGHTHQPWDEIKKNIRILNPGTLGGVFQKATFAVWNTNTDEFELKLLEQI